MEEDPARATSGKLLAGITRYKLILFIMQRSANRRPARSYTYNFFRFADGNIPLASARHCTGRNFFRILTCCRSRIRASPERGQHLLSSGDFQDSILTNADAGTETIIV